MVLHAIRYTQALLYFVPSGDDDRASDFEDEPVPYCQSHLEEIHDAPTPVGNLVDRVQVCQLNALQCVYICMSTVVFRHT